MWCDGIKNEPNNRGSHCLIKLKSKLGNIDKKTHLDKPKKLSNYFVLDGLISDADHMADKSSDAVFKSAHRCNHVWPVMDSLPKNFELTHFQKVSQVQDVGDLKVAVLKIN